MADRDKSDPRKDRVESEVPPGTGPGGQLLIFESVDEMRQWQKDHPLIVVDPDDDGEIPDLNDYDEL